MWGGRARGGYRATGFEEQLWFGSFIQLFTSCVLKEERESGGHAR